LEGTFKVIAELKKQIKELQDKIKTIQDSCSHPEQCVTKKYGSNTGNYDPMADCYWIDFKCSLCEKFWTEDQ
jgi:hypothetical protein